MLKFWKLLPKGIKYSLASGWYELISRFDTGDDLAFMNHGYAPMDGKPDFLDLSLRLEKHRYAVQHYHNLADSISWTGKQAVEVSSGRGGGAAYVFETFRPRSMLGIDLAQASVDYSNAAFADLDGLSFMVGDAQDLPLPDACCDILINVESSLNYPSKHRFFLEVDRVLRPGGYFLLADYRSAAGMERLRERLGLMECRIVSMVDISASIAAALELNNPRKLEMLRRQVPWPFRGLAEKFSFAGTAAHEEIARFRDGRKHYLCAVLQKPEAP